ncbi:MAG: hypothetical protein WCY01_00600 [Alkalispirochaeta sp.]|jgi:uncharacterized protein with von Willebrand factor type A (vWA) domain
MSTKQLPNLDSADRHTPEDALLYRELFAFFSTPPTNKRPAASTAIDLPRPLARSLVHFYSLIRSDTLRAVTEDLADQMARSLGSWFSRLWHQLLLNTETNGERDDEISRAALEAPSILAALLRRWWPEGSRFWRQGQNSIEATSDVHVREAIVRNLLEHRDQLRRERRNIQLERALRLVITPLADHLNETIPTIATTSERIAAVFKVPGTWNIFENAWEEIDWDRFEAPADRLDEEDDLAALVHRLVRGVDPLPERMIWQRRVEERILEKEEENGYGDVDGLVRTASPLLALPSELALLAYPETEDLFLHKLIERDILGLHSQRRKTNRFVKKYEKWQHVTALQKLGPLYVCVDTSGSMQDTAGSIAGVAALACVREALRQVRPVHVIGVHHTIHVASFPTDTGIPEENRETEINSVSAPAPVRVTPEPVMALAEILAPPGYGGADVSPALAEALERLENRPEQGSDTADILIISDIHFPKIGPDHRIRINRLQSRGWVRFHVLTIGLQPVEDPLNVFDYRWHYNTAEEVDFRPGLKPRYIGITRQEV